MQWSRVRGFLVVSLVLGGVLSVKGQWDRSESPPAGSPHEWAEVGSVPRFVGESAAVTSAVALPMRQASPPLLH
jgi:hypothetical protein